jgi:hypothetical protein
MLISGFSSHLDQGTLGLYAVGDLPAGHDTTVENHLANRAYCRADLRRMEELVLALHTVDMSVPPRPGAISRDSGR